MDKTHKVCQVACKIQITFTRTLSIDSKLIIYKTYLRQMLENMVKTIEPECRIYVYVYVKNQKDQKAQNIHDI